MTGTGLRHVDPANVEQQRAWDGDEGGYWADHADRFDQTVADYHRALLAAAGLRPADRVLDLGCGTGQTTRDAARLAPQGHALGVDLSSAMLAVARESSGGITNVAFEQADAQVHRFEPGGFDVALSRTGCMFFADPVAAFGNVASALRPGGRLALAVWRPVPENEWFTAITGALAAGRDLPAPPPEAPGPFSMSDPATVQRVLAAAGFADVDLAPVQAGMHFGDTPEDTQAFLLGLLGWLLRDVDEATRRRAHEDLLAMLRAHHTDDGVVLGSAMWLVTARRR